METQPNCKARTATGDECELPANHTGPHEVLRGCRDFRQWEEWDQGTALENYRSGYSCGYADGKDGAVFRDEAAGRLFLRLPETADA